MRAQWPASYAMSGGESMSQTVAWLKIRGGEGIMCTIAPRSRIAMYFRVEYAFWGNDGSQYYMGAMSQH